MSLAAPKVNPGAQAAPPAAMGADALRVGSDNTVARTQGAIGRLALRVGKAKTASPTSTTGA
jgi:hypothetical protein